MHVFICADQSRKASGDASKGLVRAERGLSCLLHGLHDLRVAYASLLRKMLQPPSSPVSCHLPGGMLCVYLEKTTTITVDAKTNSQYCQDHEKDCAKYLERKPT